MRKPNRRAGFAARLITVTDLHVRDGVRADCYCCAVHLAIREQVTTEDFHLDGDDVTWEFTPVQRSRLPLGARQLIRLIDRLSPVPVDFPRQFWLQVPTGLVRPELTAVQSGGAK